MIYCVGDTVGVCTILRELSKKGNKRYFEVSCVCGKIHTKRLDSMKNGFSCGCIQKIKVSEANKTHGFYGSRLYCIWGAMIQRITNPNHPSFYDYGGRGILIHPDWLKFENFLEWSNNNGYSDDLEIDREDNDYHYYPENCRWVTESVGGFNRRTSNNTSGKVGVTWDEPKNMWQASINLHKKTEFLGRFENLNDAIEAREIAEIRLYGKIKGNEYILERMSNEKH